MPSALGGIQQGLSVWVADVQRLVYPRGQTPDQNIAASRIDQFWSDVLLLLRSIGRHDTALLNAVEQLMVSAFSSPSKDIVNNTIIFWNSTFGKESGLEYSPKLAAVLRARRSQAELSLPGFPEDGCETEVIVLPEFAESQSVVAPAPRFEFSPAPRRVAGPQRSQSPENFLIKQHLAVHGLAYDAQAVRAESSTASTPAKVKAAPKLRHDDSQIQFAPIDSSPVSFNGESQLLTDHQKEVKDRQRGDAQMFSEMSSSPAVRSTAASKNIAKKLNFTAGPPNAGQDDVEATPTGTTDANPMSDDLPSSPTPRASAVNNAKVQMDEDDEDAYETDCDPPSSPPRGESNKIAAQAPVTEDEIEVAEESNDVGSDLKSAAPGLDSDLPSDTVLPADQLQREAAAAVDEPTVVESSPAKESVQLSIPVDSIDSSKDHAQTPFRIEDSMIQPSEDNTPEFTNSNTSKGHRGSKKRKRAAEKAASAKKQKQSPFKTFWTGLLSRSQEIDEDDDIDDEIVVASSQNVRSPSPTPERKTKPLSPQVVVTLKRQASTTSLKESEAAEPVQSKRSKKAKNAESREALKAAEAVEAEPTSGSKRRASAMSTVEDKLDSSISRVEDTPAPRKTKKKRRSKAARQAQEGDSVAVRSSTRSSTGGSQSQSQTVEDPEPETDHEEASPEKQLAEESQSAANRGKKVVQPASILGRLRGVLADCKKMIIGQPEDEREFDDVLYEIRKEIFEAERRGRAA
jgi:hypothetical protein